VSHCSQCQREVPRPARLIGSSTVGQCICGTLVLFLAAEAPVFNSEALNEIQRAIGERAMIRRLEARPPENDHLHTDSGGSWVVQQEPFAREATTSSDFGTTPQPPLRPTVYASIIQQWHDTAHEANWAAQRVLLGRRYRAP
jgi:hypothetical protein